MSAPSAAAFIMKRPWLHKMVLPVAEWYKNAAGYRRLGLKYVWLFKSSRIARMLDNFKTERFWAVSDFIAGQMI